MLDDNPLKDGLFLLHVAGADLDFNARLEIVRVADGKIAVRHIAVLQDDPGQGNFIHLFLDRDSDHPIGIGDLCPVGKDAQPNKAFAGNFR